MKKSVMKKWVKALRSGDFEQGKNYLNDGKGNYCCLGVLCEVLGLPKRKNVVGSLFEYGTEACPATSFLPDEAKNLSGIKSALGNLPKRFRRATKLSELNDSKGFTFKQIAKVIEKYYKEL